MLVEENESAGICIDQPADWQTRRNLAEICCSTLNLSIPCAVDTIDAAVDNLYAGFPDRIFVIDRHGRIAYAGNPGPWGLDPAEAEEALLELR